MSFLKYPLDYQPDSAQLFERLRHQPWAIWLDSGQPNGQYGRYDILVADPFITITSSETCSAQVPNAITEIRQDGKVSLSAEDPFVILNRLLAPFQAVQTELPFCGGALGYFGYDLGRKVEAALSHPIDQATLPDMMVGIYDWAVVIDHREKTACLVSHGFHPGTHNQWAELCALFDKPAVDVSSYFALTSPIRSNMDFEKYAQAFHQVKHYITEGDCYQVNLAQRFSAQANGDGWLAYLKLRKISPAPFMAYMNFGAMQVLSGSPERFLQVVANRVETRPIKGTRPRSEDAVQDQRYAAALQASVKDKAENLMIVDLLRNDISKNCKTGSVKADKLFQLQSFANVHHLVSFVSGVLQAGKTAIDLLRGCFPGGSITGAPKLRAMQIIDELEPNRRGVYCGAIGYIGFDGNMDTNIAIRTAVYANGEISFYAGGGIVADSVLDKEYAETLDKASSLIASFQSFQTDQVK
ncbi:MAG: aminodeoxychorismate synthase component I [Methylophilales bacterium]|nr:aminodeoxychorismate synthase component I [Methylophilales bacterium]